MFSIGNIKPVKKAVGNIIPIMEISMAVYWEEVLVEISSPKDKQMMMNKVLSP